MTAVAGGSTSFVQGVLVPFEVQEMYAIVNGLNVGGRRDEGLREYSRLEYATPDGSWLLVAAGQIPRRRRTSARRRPFREWLRRRAARVALEAAPEPLVVEG